MQRQTSRDSHATFNGGLKRNRNTPSPSEEQQYFFKQQINNKDFETFQPREDALDESSNTSSVAIPVDLKRRYEQDMHLMLDDLEMPNQSMNLSSLNHSQWQGRSTRSYLSSLSNNQQSSQQPSARQDSNSNLTMSNSHFDSQEKLSRHDDSPDFNRPNDMVSVTDELTVSLSDNSKVGYVGESKSYREFEQVQQPILKNQNRTFADSVINHQINGLVNTKNPQTAIKLSGSVSKTAALGQSKTIDASRQFGHKITYLDSAETLEDVLDQSDISELDLLTRTQISQNIQGIDPNARSRIMMPQFLQDSMSQSQITVPGSNPITKRTQNSILQQLANDASELNFTPDKDSHGQSTNSLNWQLKSQNAKDAPESSESTSQINTDRGQDYSNPIAQLKQRIKQSNIQKRQGSKSRDTELYEALETPYSKSPSELQLQIEELQNQNRQLSKSCEVYQNQIIELQKQTNQKAPSGNDLMRARALEAARAENKELQKLLDQRESRIIELEKEVLNFEQKVESERQQYLSKIESLDLQLEKQKILIQGCKRESETKVDQAQSDLQQVQQTYSQFRKQTEDNSIAANNKLLALQTQLQQQEQTIQMQQQDIQVKENKLKQVRNQMTQLECQVHSLETDLQLQTQQCKQYEQEIDLVRQRNTQVHSLSLPKNTDNGFDQELKRVKQLHQQQVNKLTEQIHKLQQNESGGLDALAALLQVNPAAVFSTVQSLISNQDSNQAIINQKATEIASLTKQLADKEIAGQHMQQNVADLQNQLSEALSKLKQQEALVVQQSSNFTKNLLHQKDVDLQNLREQLNAKQEQEWDLQQQVVALSKECETQRSDKLELQKDLSAVRKLKQIAEANVQEVKDKLRSVLNQSQDDQVRAKYDEIIEAVMNVKFADDPLEGLVDLQTSFTVHEQAVQHLVEQQKLASNQQLQLAQLKSTLQSQQSQNYQLCKEIKGLAQSRDLAAQELKSTEEALKRQSEVISELERKVIENQDQARFLSILDSVIEGTQDSKDCQLRDLIEQKINKIQQDLSKIEENPLQDKSGKHEAFLFLAQLQSAKWVQTDNSAIEQLQSEVQQKQTAFEMLNQQLMSELQLKTDEFEIEVQRGEAERIKHVQELQRVKSECERKLRELGEQHEFKVSELEVEFQHRLEQDSNQTRTQSKDYQDRLQQVKLEEKRLKAEIEKLKKQMVDVKAANSQEIENVKDRLEQEFKVKLDEVAKESKSKTKEAVDSKVTQVRSEMLNKISELKNEHARIQADWQRERTKWETQKQDSVEQLKKDLEKQQEQQLKEAKIVVERVWKKRLDELKAQQNEKLKEIDGHLEELKASHREELRKQTKVWQQKLKAQQETDMPRQVAAMTQVSPQVTRSVEIQPKQQKCSCHIEIENQNMFIEQLKINFEQELERYEQIHLADQKQKVQQTIQTFEQLICLEIEKILVTLAAKASGQSADQKRNQLNQLIKQLYSQHKDDQNELKRAFEVVKSKISTVLNTLKQQLEHKYKSRQTIQIDDTDNESQLVSESSRQQIVRHSTTSSAEVNLTNNQSQEMSPPHGRHSELKNYIEYQERQDTIMQRLAPQSQSSKGTPVVEVDKVVRDLQMLYQTTKMAKFCRILLGNQIQDDGSLSARSSTENIVSTYRDLLNSFFRLISKLNQQSDQVCQDQEVFRLRLLNVDLSQQVNELVKEQSGVVTRQMVQDVITFYQSQNVGPRVKQVLDALEQLHFQISKNQFKLNQLADLFTKEGRVNNNIREVAQKCDEFLELDQFMQSSFQNKYLPPEMMSPDETAHLIATVIQKLPNKTMSVTSEDILKQALQICHDQSVVSMPPLQRLPARLRTASTIQTSKTPRSQSTGIQPNLINMPRQMLVTSGSLYQTVEPQNRYLSQPNMQGVNERYGGSTQEQIRLNTKDSKVPMSLSQETDFQIDDGDAHHSSLDEELACAQSNVNQLFEKLKGSRFNTLQY